MKGCRIRISVYFAVLVACIIIVDNTGLALYALLCILVHESGHLIAIGLLKIQISEIGFTIFGIHIKMKSHVSLSYRQEIRIALAGAAANLIFALFCLLFLTFGYRSGISEILLAFNLLIACFSLVPAASLDGGRALEALLSFYKGPDQADRIMKVVSFFLILPLAAAGFFLVIRTGYNYSLILVVAYLAVSLALKGHSVTQTCEFPSLHKKKRIPSGKI